MFDVSYLWYAASIVAVNIETEPGMGAYLHRGRADCNGDADS